MFAKISSIFLSTIFLLLNIHTHNEILFLFLFLKLSIASKVAIKVSVIQFLKEIQNNLQKIYK